jgi:SAM-dependent methyltransferase
MLSLRKRAQLEELLDRSDNPQSDLERSLSDLETANSRLGGRRALLRHALPLLDEASSVLDIGCGSADILRAISVESKRKGRMIKLSGVDAGPAALAIARSRSEAFPEIELVQSCATSLPFDDGSFDIVLSSLLLHHLEPESVVQALREAARVSRRRVVITDLIRSGLAFITVLLVGKLVFGRLSRYDGPVSVRRAYTPNELLGLAQEAGLTGCRVYTGPIRMALVYDKDDV